ncbi:MAG: acyloxyacyl hydrolase [Chlamydiota bacterium]
MNYLITLLIFICPLFFLHSEEKKLPPKLLNVGIGVYDIIHDPHHVLLQLEYRTFFKRWTYLRPLIGIMGTEKATLYIYGGIAGDIFLGKSFVLTPSFAPGIYFKGKGKDLGFPLEFRSAIELSYVLPSQGRLGAQFYHLSNASYGNKNPGSESLVFFYSIPL